MASNAVPNAPTLSLALVAFAATALGETGSGADDEENEPFYAEPPAPPVPPPAPPASPPSPLPLSPPIVEWMTESERTSTAVTLSLVTVAMWAVCCLYCAVRAFYVRAAKQRYGVAASDSALLNDIGGACGRYVAGRYVASLGRAGRSQAPNWLSLRSIHQLVRSRPRVPTPSPPWRPRR